jgi:serine/threonine protein kinase
MSLTNNQEVVHNGSRHIETAWEEITTSKDESLPLMLLSSMQMSRFTETQKQYLPQDAFEKVFYTVSKRNEDVDLTVFVPMGINAATLTEAELSLAYHIVDHCQKLYLIAVSMGLGRENIRTLMTIFRARNFTDEDIPIAPWTLERLKTDTKLHPLVVMETLEGNRTSYNQPIWNVLSLYNFQNEQWKFLAPIISTGKDLHDFGLCTIPFVDRYDVISKGGKGIVYRYEIHHAHLEDPRGVFKTKEARPERSGHDEAKILVAVKQMRKDGNEVAKYWEKEVTALARMNQLDQEHIVRFITAFRLRTISDAEEHYLMFEWADGGNLNTHLAAYPYPALTAARTKWVIRQLHGLAQALSRAHYLDSGGSYRHGDLKPDNILWFRKGDTEFGTLKIGDWGEAKEHEQLTSLRHDTTTQFATRRYEPPEVVTGVSLSLSDEIRFVRSRLYDTWGMGCITLEILIWLVYGLNELKTFNRKSIGTYGNSDCYYEVMLDEPAKVHGVAEHYMEQIAKHLRRSQHKSALGDLLELVKTGLLIVKLPVDGGAKRQASNAGELQLAVNIGDNLDTVPNNGISIQVTPDPSDPTIARPGEPERYLATDLEGELWQILENTQDESYWLLDLSPKPAPAEYGRPYLSARSTSNTSVRSALNSPWDQKDYGEINYDPQIWKFDLANDLAEQIFSRFQDAKLSPPMVAPPSHKLCDECLAASDRIWSPFFEITYQTAELARNTRKNTCQLCSFLWHTYQKFSSANSYQVKFQRSGTMLTMDGLKSPVLTLLRNNGTI